MPSLVPPERFFRESKTLHRSTQELSLQAAELDAALTRDEAARFQQSIRGQAQVRVSGAVALAIASVFVSGGSPLRIAFAAVVTGFYLVMVLRMSAIARKQQSSRRDVIPLAIA